jgi:hypothetical protein
MVEPTTGTLIFNAKMEDGSSSTFEAHLNFDRAGDSQGGIFSVTGKIMGSDGTISPSRTLPSGSNPSVFTVPASNEEMSTATEENGTSGDSPDILMTSRKSVLQRFKDFKGKQGLKAFVALFDRNPGEQIVQYPPVALSDGKTLVRITLPLLTKEEAPDIALSDAKLMHLEKKGEKSWEITALPNEGSWNAVLLIKMDEKAIEFPLVVATPAKINKGITERNFVVELDTFIFNQAGSGKMESDPFRQILYEYVFTANYIASSGDDPAKTTSEQANLRSNSK